MGEAREVQVQITAVQEPDRAHSTETTPATYAPPPPPGRRSFKWWVRIGIYSLLVLSAQTAAVLLGRLYFEKGGKSKWMETLVVTLGTPILIPFYLYFSPKKHTNTNNPTTKLPSLLTLTMIYGFLGILISADNFMYATGLSYLPVSTYSLICASQLGFTALFSFFLNSQRFTSFIVNSLVLLTISATLLVFQSDSTNSTGVSKTEYTIGFLCTVGASALYSLILSLTQLIFQKVIKKESFKTVLDMIIYESIAANVASLVGLIASSEWKSLKGEMEGFGLGKSSYVMVLVWTSICWALFALGSVGLILEVSSLFCNAISTLGLPIVPVLAVIVFHDSMDGIKVIAMLLAIWGFVSYVYQHYLDSSMSKSNKSNVNEASEHRVLKVVNNVR